MEKMNANRTREAADLAGRRVLLADMPEEQRLAWYDYSLKFCDKEEYLSHAEHLMVVSKKS